MSDAAAADRQADAAARAAALMRGAVDMHVHAAPDVIPRKLDDLELATQARAAGMAALVLKAHTGWTAERAFLLSKLFPEIRVFGSVTLNETVGGLNPAAVDTALKLGARVVWMPTRDARNHRTHHGRSGGIAIVEGSTLVPAMTPILRLVADAGAVLATGHVSPDESGVLIDAALAAGVARICVTHPEWGVTAMPLAQQQALARTGRVFFERCFVSTQPDLLAHVPFERIVEQIRCVGPETSVVATDFGMPQYPSPVDGLREYLTRLAAAGFTDKAIAAMVRHNPARLLGLETPPGAAAATPRT